MALWFAVPAVSGAGTARKIPEQVQGQLTQFRKRLGSGPPRSLGPGLAWNLCWPDPSVPNRFRNSGYFQSSHGAALLRPTCVAS